MNKETRVIADLATTETRSRAPLLLDIAIFAQFIVELLALTAMSAIVVTLLYPHADTEQIAACANATLVGVFFFAGLAELTGCYDADIRFSVRNAWSRLLTAWFSTAMFMLTLSFLLRTTEYYPRGWGIGWFAAGGGALCLVRLVGIGWMRSLKRTGLFNQRVAIFGAGEQGCRLATYILANDKLTIDLVGFFDDRAPERLESGGPKLAMRGNLDRLIALIREGHVDQVIVALPWSAEVRLQEIVSELAITPVRIRLAPDLASFAFAQRSVVLLGDMPVMTLFERPISGFDQVIKRLEDLVFSICALIVLAPLLIVVALAIRIDSKGPILFRQDREGLNNRCFSIWKFRSMYHDSCQTDHITQARPDDPRITRVGRLIRRLSLDELPQLLNVVRGEMSLVGPRPHASSTRAGNRRFGDVVKTYAARHKVRPGITGWAQVCGWRGETDTEDKLIKRLEHDLYYIENWSISFDLYILLRTIAILPFQRRVW